ncbi:hypothetical protein D3C85_1451000 [compost metagenome]
MAAYHDRRNKQKGFKNVEFEADINACFGHQQRTNRIADGTQQPHHAQQLQNRDNPAPLLAKHQRDKIV